MLAMYIAYDLQVQLLPYTGKRWRWQHMTVSWGEVFVARQMKKQ